MSRARASSILLLGSVAVAFAPSAARAQSILQRARDRARQGVTDRVNGVSDAAVDSALSRGDQRIRCVVGDAQCIHKVQAAHRQVILTDSTGTVLPDQNAAMAASAAAGAPVAASAAPSSAAAPDSTPAAPSAPPGSGAWLNYDFVPGDRVLWWEDFAADDVGDFPRRMQLVAGNFEVVNIGGHKYLRSVEGGQVLIILPQALPQQFTMEVRYYSPSVGNPLAVQTSGGDNATWGCYHGSGWVQGGSNMATSSESVDDIGEHDFVNCRFTISDRYIKAYLNEHRVANVPTTNVARTDSILLTIPAADQNDPTLITDIRIAAGGRRLYDALSANGRVATQGILFDTGSDHIRGESTPTLKEIGDMLTEHADLKLTIEGHTDNVGAAAANQSLSERRAAAVRQYLIDQFHIDASRLTSVGFGASHPAAPNTTPEGRQTNRRVELVRM